MRYLIPEPTDPALHAQWVAAVVARQVDAAYPAVAPVRHHHQVVNYLDMGQIGALFGVSAGTVSKWRTRYADTHPCPKPDSMTGQTPGWLPARKADWEAWHAARPGQGAPGRPKPRRVQPE